HHHSRDCLCGDPVHCKLQFHQPFFTPWKKSKKGNRCQENLRYYHPPLRWVCYAGNWLLQPLFFSPGRTHNCPYNSHVQQYFWLHAFSRVLPLGGCNRPGRRHFVSLLINPCWSYISQTMANEA